jgi:hypothetical protein
MESRGGSLLRLAKSDGTPLHQRSAFFESVGSTQAVDRSRADSWQHGAEYTGGVAQGMPRERSAGVRGHCPEMQQVFAPLARRAGMDSCETSGRSTAKDARPRHRRQTTGCDSLPAARHGEGAPQ